MFDVTKTTNDKMKDPKNATKIIITLPGKVYGDMSPYPTEVKVITIKYIYVKYLP